MKRTSWQPVSGWYDTSVGAEGDFTHREIVIPGTLALLGLTGQSAILDLGCGQGILARSIPPSLRYTGVDISPALIAAARKRDRSDRHAYFTGDITRPVPHTGPYTHAAAILVLDNLEHPDLAIKNAAIHLPPGGVFTFVINHPCFRIPRQSSWGIDESNKIQYRRINRYLSPLSIPITAHPGSGAASPVTWTFHFPVSRYIQWLHTYGFYTDTMEEWVSTKTSAGKAASMENRSRSEFPLFLAVKAVKKEA